MLPNAPKMKPLLSSTVLKERVTELGQQIARDFHGEPVILIGVLKGSFIFFADLVRSISLDLSVDFIGVASYLGTASTGQVRITHDLSVAIDGKNVVLVEDIVDTGITLDFLLDTMRVRNPKSLKICALLSKPEARHMHHPLDYVGFEITNEFVVGYGLDLDQRFRQLPDLMQVIEG
jgi:hypoxanthine phosphoribosyltransferase